MDELKQEFSDRMYVQFMIELQKLFENDIFMIFKKRIMKCPDLGVDLKIHLNDLHRTSFFIKIQELAREGIFFKVKGKVHARQKAKEVTMFTPSGIIFPGWLKKYGDLNFWKVLTLYYDHCKTLRDDLLVSKQQELIGHLTCWLANLNFIPSFSASSVWDMEGIVLITELEVQEQPNKRQKKDQSEKRSELQSKLLKFFPSKINYCKSYYFEVLKRPTEQFWIDAFPNCTYPLPTSPDEQWNVEMNGFMLYCITFSILQLVSHGGGFSPRQLKEGKTFQLDKYFPKFIVFLIVNRCMETQKSWSHAFLGELNEFSLSRYPQKVSKVITDNTKLTTKLYYHIKISSNFADFWKAAVQYEGNAAYYGILFKVSKEVLFPIPN